MCSEAYSIQYNNRQQLFVRYYLLISVLTTISNTLNGGFQLFVF